MNTISHINNCHKCNETKSIRSSVFRQNVSYLFRRQEKEFRGSFCFRCTSILFFKCTLITLIGTWWGVIGALIGPVYIIQNIYFYLKSVLSFLFSNEETTNAA
jgi:hypothetical protein